jgi:hypothetical protein
MCAGGVCQPVALASAPGIAGLTTDGTTLYWPAGASVYSCPGSGCNGLPFVVTNKGSSKPGQILVAAGSVYWWNFSLYGGFIEACPLGGCGSNAPATVPKANPILGAMASDGQRLYWAGYSADAGNVAPLVDCPLGSISSCMPMPYWSQNASGQFTNPSYAIASNGSYVAWLDTIGGNVVGCSGGTTCSSVATFASHKSNLSLVAIDASRVYWSDSMGIWSCTIAGCTSPTAIAPGQSGNSLASDGTNVYWTSGTSVMRASLAGSISTIANNQQGADYVAVDSARVYWAVSTGWVMSVAK